MFGSTAAVEAIEKGFFSSFPWMLLAARRSILHTLYQVLRLRTYIVCSVYPSWWTDARWMGGSMTACYSSRDGMDGNIKLDLLYCCCRCRCAPGMYALPCRAVPRLARSA